MMTPPVGEVASILKKTFFSRQEGNIDFIPYRHRQSLEDFCKLVEFPFFGQDIMKNRGE